MAIVSQVQQIRGTTAQLATFTGNAGVLAVDLTKKTLTVHDGTTAGGTPLAKEGITFKTDADALLKFNGAATATLASDVTITLDKEAVTGAVVEAIKDDADVAKELAPALISTNTDNALQADTTDGLLFVKKMDVDALVDADDAILSVNADDEIISTLGFSYTVADGKFTVTGKAGAQIYQTVIPTSLTLLKTAEVVTNPTGQPAGTYLHFVFDLQSGAESEIYVNVTSFIDVYTPGDGLQYNASDDHKFELKLAASGNQAKIESGALVVPTDYGTLD